MLEIDELDAFYGEAQALWSVSLTVHNGETVCVIGPNGAGKSTLVHAIAGLVPRRRGRIILDGNDLAVLAVHRICAHGVATVPEGRRVFASMSVYDNLCLGAYRRGARSTYRETLADVYELFP